MPNSTATIPRRHDLDALRAVAMLLGIALHGALAYMPLPAGAWPVQDARSSGAFGIFMALVHGFRMPLFFLVSGFFTAMLWRKRGLKSLLFNRFQRIFIPLFIGMFTIVPAVWIVSIGAGMSANSMNAEAEPNIWTAAKTGNLQTIQRLLSDVDSLDAIHSTTGVTPMTLAAMNGQEETVKLLIENGADVNARNRDKSTSLHGAVLLGQRDTARLLVQQGIDVNARDEKGYTAKDVLGADWATTQWIANALGIKIDRDQVTEGRTEIGRMLQSAQPLGIGISEGAIGSGELESNERNPFTESPSGLYMLLTMFPFYQHLWFLSFLCWYVLAFSIYAILAGRINRKVPAWLVVSPLRYLWLIPVTLIPQSSMGLLYPTFGPDTSAGIVPIPAVLLYYAIFFFFGAIYFDSDDEQGRLGQWWKLTLPIALLVVFPVGYEFTIGGWGFGDRIDPDLHRPIAILLQVIFAWMMTFGSMGFFRSLLARESKAMRYVSDSSYWLYLLHLPLIIVAQAIVRDWPIPAIAKFTVVCVATSGLLLLSYQVFVRYTPIGTLLNGPRRRPREIATAMEAEASRTCI